MDGAGRPADERTVTPPPPRHSTHGRTPARVYRLQHALASPRPSVKEPRAPGWRGGDRGGDTRPFYDRPSGRDETSHRSLPAAPRHTTARRLQCRQTRPRESKNYRRRLSRIAQARIAQSLRWGPPACVDRQLVHFTSPRNGYRKQIENLLVFVQPRWQLRRTYFFNHYDVLF